MATLADLTKTCKESVFSRPYCSHKEKPLILVFYEEKLTDPFGVFNTSFSIKALFADDWTKLEPAKASDVCPGDYVVKLGKQRPAIFLVSQTGFLSQVYPNSPTYHKTTSFNYENCYVLKLY